MEKLDLIKAAHIIDHQLGLLSAGVTDEGLKKRISNIHTEWQELAYLVSAHLCGVESKSLHGAPRKRGGRKKIDGAVEQPLAEASQTSEEEHGGLSSELV